MHTDITERPPRTPVHPASQRASRRVVRAWGGPPRSARLAMTVALWALSAALAVAIVGCKADEPGGSGDGEVGGSGGETSGTGGGDGGSSEPGCSDNDGDGFGLGCSRGDDCNDFNPEIQTCDCDDGNFAGCPCLSEGATQGCFDGIASQEGVGVCRGGTRTCEGGVWSGCVGQTAPTREVCDEQDNDCDGQVDDGLMVNACGNCDPQCDAEGVGQGEVGEWDLAANGSDGLVENDEGGLELDAGQLDIDFLWVANSEEGTVSKIDTRTGQEIGRYPSARRLNNNMPASSATCPPTDSNPQGNCPSRTAVDLNGDVWVANRAFSGQGSVSKIANKDCIDRNGNGSIETSRDLNGNGVIDLSGGEYLGEADECLLFTVTIGGNQGIPRALAIDPFTPERGVGSVWVGAWGERRYYQINGRDGSLIRTVDVPHRPYGAVMDRFGTLWSTDLGAANSNQRHTGLVSVVSETGQTGGPYAIRSTSSCSDGYGITVGPEDNIWLGGWSCGAVFRYTPSTSGWATFQLPSGAQYVRGVAADRDGWIYAGISNNSDGNSVGQIVRFRGSDGANMQTWNLAPSGQGTIGVGLDYQGNVWGVNQVTNNAARLNPNTGQWQAHPTGRGPYTYSDFTGYALRNFTAPQGTYRRIFTACPQRDSSIWTEVSWDSFEPPGTGVEVRIKSVAALDDLVTAPQFGPFTQSPTDLLAEGVPEGKFLEVEVTLWSESPIDSPILWNLKTEWRCPRVQ